MQNLAVKLVVTPLLIGAPVWPGGAGATSWVAGWWPCP
jgi:hypothetical protein